MVWVKFTQDYDFKPKQQVTIAYRAGDEVNVTRVCSARAIALGKAVLLRGNLRKNNRLAETSEKAEALALGGKGRDQAGA
ncbi:hypothetical protein [Pseudochrobactrum lubricantis]|uniref:hypothetical protein n=1 Tax=Pseudochrobactrum lubricantis TaxID=558172 RepID=UPI0035E2101B